VQIWKTWSRGSVERNVCSLFLFSTPQRTAHLTNHSKLMDGWLWVDQVWSWKVPCDQSKGLKKYQNITVGLLSKQWISILNSSHRKIMTPWLQWRKKFGWLPPIRKMRRWNKRWEALFFYIGYIRTRNSKFYRIMVFYCHTKTMVALGMLSKILC